MPEKILTIIVPSYNMEKYLPKCLGSLMVAPELMERLEVLVVNDGSKDRTSEIAHEFEAKWPGTFRVIDKENGHYGSCVNAGLGVAKGEWVKVLDADDWFETGNFAEYLRFLIGEAAKGSAAADLIVSDFEFVSEDCSWIKSYAFMDGAEFDIARFDYRNGHDLWMHAIAYRTEKVRRIGYCQLTGMTHTDIQWLHLPMSTVERVAYFPKVIYKYLYLREGNTSTPDEFYRTYHVQVRILKTLIAEYESAKEKVGDHQAVYLRNHVLFRAFRAYQVHVVERSPLLNQKTLVDFDDYLKTNHKWLYDEVAGFRYLNHFQYNFIRDWRKEQRISVEVVTKLWLLRRSISVYAWIRKIMGR